MKPLAWIAWGMIGATAFAQDHYAGIRGIDNRAALSQRQAREIEGRLSANPALSCDQILAPLPSVTGTMPFAGAVFGIERSQAMIKSLLPGDCMARLVQDLSLQDGTVAPRLIAYFADALLDRSFFHAPVAQESYCSSPDTALEQILRFGREIPELAACAPTGARGYRRINTTSLSEGSTSYSLFADGRGNTSALLNVSFHNDPSGTMLARARRCLAAISPSLRTPDGQSLSVTLLTPAETQALPADVRPRPRRVTVVAAGVRSFSDRYASDASCPVIVHEMFHLLGLCDEYPGDRDEYSCRAAGPTDSLMSDHALAFQRQVPRTVRCEFDSEFEGEGISALTRPPHGPAFLRQNQAKDYVTQSFLNAYCESEVTVDQSSWRDLSAPPPRRADFFAGADANSLRMVDWVLSPQGQIARSERNCRCTDDRCRQTVARLLAGNIDRLRLNDCSWPLVQQHVAWGQAREGFSVQGDTVTFGVPRSGVLLRPAHVRQIVERNCRGSNQVYRRCAQRAYQNSCGPMPAECRGDWTR